MEEFPALRLVLRDNHEQEDNQGRDNARRNDQMLQIAQILRNLRNAPHFDDNLHSQLPRIQLFCLQNRINMRVYNDFLEFYARLYRLYRNPESTVFEIQELQNINRLNGPRHYVALMCLYRSISHYQPTRSQVTQQALVNFVGIHEEYSYMRIILLSHNIRSFLPR